MNRRFLLALPLLAAGCSVLPSRPYLETRRYALEPRRPAGPRLSSPRGAILLRTLRSGPGMEVRGLRRVRQDGTLDVAFYDEWLAPPADLVEAALREWLIASGTFTAVAAPGSRLSTPYILEAELITLQAEPAQARAGMTALLLAEGVGLADPRVLAQRRFEVTTPLPAEATPAAQAAGMQDALGRLFGELEGWLAASIPAEGRRR
ncbi:ABC-type transport auxiliary lipoprotein family protein [Roseococcus pinisoli]|uniref:Membrane integrity-associated transporter subunit PqiC n=1 Tax=Roseococcus pinisoli TaxID=2835040 RepID=A0ABS5Q9J8_9PROT|nr:ABC-type transport auxiliary lipoprotein family protein [Roseococcus pinisoli]MBS7810178.1 membrane integrity-associated transporter subunit PqiC [Roseococcus pinisoli]